MASTAAPRPSPRIAPTKLRPPSIDTHLNVRTRLSDLIDSGHRIVFVLGPAGYGKTVVAAHWAARRHEPVAWFTVDEHDSTPSKFWRYLAASFQRVVPGIGSETIAAIDEWATDGFDMVAALLADIGDDPGELSLVIDDIHHIIDPDVMRQLEFFLERVPADVRVVLTSRTAPQLPTARWRAQSTLTELRQADLVLTDDEARAMLRTIPTLQLAPSAEDRLVGLTAGWAAALQLVGLSLRDRPDAADVVQRHLDDDRVLFDYVVGEVLDQLTDDERRAVLAMSVLDDIDARRCELLTGTTDGDALLRQLVNRGLPLVALEPARATYRFHQLFRALVRLELVVRDQSAVESIHRRAAVAELDAGDHAAAVRHLLAVGDHAACFDLVFGPVWDLYRAGQTFELSRWLDDFPAEFVGTDPARIIPYATTLALVGRPDDAARWNLAADRSLPADDPLRFDLALSATLVHLTNADTGAIRDDVRTFERSTGRTVADTDHDALFSSTMAIAALIDEVLPEADFWVDEITISRHRPERRRSIGQPVRQAWLAYEHGDLAAAEQLGHDALSKRNAGSAAPHALVEVTRVMALIALERGDHQGGRAWAEQAIEVAAGIGSSSRPMLHHFLAHDAMVAAIDAAAGPGTALDAVAEMTAVSMAPQLQLRYLTLSCELLARSGRLDHCERVARALRLSPRRQLVEARVALLRDRRQSAATMLSTLDTSEWPVRRQIEAALLRYRSAPDDPATLRHAVELGAPRGHVATYLREGSEVTQALRSIVSNDSEWRSTPLAVALANEPTARVSPRQALVEPLSAREMEVLELLPTHLSTIELARQLYVSSNTVRTHIKAIYRKLSVSSRSEAVDAGGRLGLIGDGHSITR